MSERTSLRAFAKLIGVTDKAVRKAIASGRLRASVGRDDQGPFVADVELGRQEWETGRGQVARTGAARTTASAGTQGGQLISAETLHDAQRLTTLERRRKLKLANDVTEGRLVDVRSAAKEAFESARVIRESVLNLPARISAELAAETDPGRVYRILDAALREALVATAEAVAAVNE